MKKPPCKDCKHRHLGCHSRQCPFGWDEYEKEHQAKLDEAAAKKVSQNKISYIKLKNSRKNLRKFYK